jgi:hypothetical protein
MRVPSRLSVLPALVPLVLLVACGGMSSPSGQGVVLKGTLMGAASGSSASIAAAGNRAAETITVTVQGTSITTTVDANGSFTLRGLPEGGFTLVFTNSGGAVLGTLTFGAVMPNQEITIVVDVSTGTVVLVEEKRNGIGHGDVEIEGPVLTAPVLDPATGDSRFTVNGYTIVARPGQTAIREGNTARTIAEVTIGRQVHVKGSWLPLEGTLQPVLALEIKLQDDEGDDGEDTKTCMIEGGRALERIELEGKVLSGGTSASFMLKVQGNRASGPVQVDGSNATFQCSPSGGPNAATPAQCQARVIMDAKVHVRGNLTTCTLTAAAVKADKVIVQK